MSEWQECKLGEFIDVINGFAFKSANFLADITFDALPVIKIKNVANGDANLDGVQYHYYSENLSKYVVEKNDVLVALTGNHPQAETQVVGLTSRYKLNSKALLNQRVAKIISKDEKTLSSDFIYYFLKDSNTHLYLAGQSSGSANQANISKSDIENIPFCLPSKDEQRTIANILSSLDDKIDLLRRQNKTLEAMAETLFRQWFIEEAREDWAEKTLGDVVNVIDNRGKTPPYQDISTEFPIIEVNALTGTNRLVDYSAIRKYVTEDVFNSWFRGHPKKFDTLISTVGSIGEISMYLVEIGSVAQNVVALSAKNISPFYLFEFLKRSKDEIKELDIGSVQPSIKVPHLLSIKIIIPPIEKIELFDVQVESYLARMLTNQKQIKTLEKLRDNLLPKLMSGEVRVKLTEQAHVK